MLIKGITEVFEEGEFVIHKIYLDSGCLHRTSVPSTVGVILHDPINDWLGLSEQIDKSTLTDSIQLPEVTYEPMESSYNAANRFCEGLGVNPKSVSFVQTIISDYNSSSKQVTLLYIVVDSREIPEDTFVSSSATELIRQLGKQEPLGAALAVAAGYLRAIRRNHGNTN